MQWGRGRARRPALLLWSRSSRLGPTPLPTQHTHTCMPRRCHSHRRPPTPSPCQPHTRPHTHAAACEQRCPSSLGVERVLGRPRLLHPLHLMHQLLLELGVQGHQLRGGCLLAVPQARLVPGFQLSSVRQQRVVPAGISGCATGRVCGGEGYDVAVARRDGGGCGCGWVCGVRMEE